MSEMHDNASIIFNWWRANIKPRTQCDPGASEEERDYQRWKQGDARALSAKLRRGTYPELLLEPQVEELANELGLGTGGRLKQLCQLLPILGEIRHDSTPTLPQRLGQKRPGASRDDDRLMSSIRFRRLMTAEGDELNKALSRAVRLVDYECNVAMFVRSMLFWNEETRNRWYLDYFNGLKPQDKKDKADKAAF